MGPATARLEELIARHGLSARRADIMRLARPCVRIRRTPTTQETLGPTTSRFGGLPHLPESVEWPKGRSGPMAFLAMVQCSAVAEFDVEGLLPKSGLLYFWYDIVEGRWGFDPKDRECFAITFAPDERAHLRLASPPANGVNSTHKGSLLSKILPWRSSTSAGQNRPFEPCVLSFASGISLPEPRWVEEHAQELRGLADDKGYDSLVEDLVSSDEPHHQLSGHPYLVQNTMELDCQLVSNGLNCGDASAYRDPRAEALKPGTLDWRLLLQIDSDEEGPGWLWGDCGMLYFWIREHDLAERRFDRSWLVMQCL